MSRVLSQLSILLALAFPIANAADTGAAPDKDKSREAVKAYVAEAAKSGKKVDVWITLFGSLSKTELMKADEKTITVSLQKNPFDQTWDKLSAKDFLNVAKASVQDEGKRSLLLADYCMAIGELDEAEKALNNAQQLNKDLGSELADRGKLLASLQSAGKPAVAAKETKETPPATPTPAPDAARKSALAAAGLGNPPLPAVKPAAPAETANGAASFLTRRAAERDKESKDKAAKELAENDKDNVDPADPSDPSEPSTTDFTAGIDAGRYPHKAGEIKAMLQLLDPRRGNLDMQGKYIHRMMQFRYICCVPYEDLAADERYVDLAYHAALICEKLGHLTHSPEKPPGMDDAEFLLCKKGAGSSNLFGGLADPIRCVDGWMDDSDKSNIDRVGHRRWCINPKMMKTGFGKSGSYAAMYAFDSARKSLPDWDFVSYPARGYMPVEFFSAHHAWSISINTSKYGIPKNKDAVKVNLRRANEKFEPEGEPLPLDYFNVDTAGYGSGPAIIFRPEEIKLGKGGRYVVEVEGLKSKKPLSFIVHFVHQNELPDDADGAAILTKYFNGRVAGISKLPLRVDQYEALLALKEDKLLEKAETAVVKQVYEAIDGMSKELPLLREHEARNRFKTAEALEKKSQKDKNKIFEAATAFNDLANEFKDTPTGLRAAAEFERMKKESQKQPE